MKARLIGLAAVVVLGLVCAAVAVAANPAPSKPPSPPLTYKTITAKQVQDAALKTGVPNFMIASMYAAGYQGDPVPLAQQLKHWYAASGGRSWTDAVADYHAQSTRGVTIPSDVTYAREVMLAGTHIPPALAGAMSVGSALTLGAIIVGAGATSLVGLWALDAGPLAAGGTAGAGGAAAKAGQTLTGGGGSQGTAADAFSTAGMSTLAATAALFLAHNISSPTQANLTQSWFTTLYHDIEQYAWVLATIAVAAMGLWVMVSQKGSDLVRVLVGIPAAGVGMLLVPVLAMAGIAFVDAGCQLVPMSDAVHALDVMAATVGALAGTSVAASALHLNHVAHFTGTGAWMVSAFGLAAAGVVALELIAREIAIYMTVLIVPIALVGSLFAPFARWATKILTVLFVLLFSKFVLVACLAAVGGLITSGVMGVIIGIVALAFVAFVPRALYGALIGLESAFHSGVAHAGLSVVQNRGMAGRVHRAGAHARSAIDARTTPPPQPKAPPTGPQRPPQPKAPPTGRRDRKPVYPPLPIRQITEGVT